MALEGGSTADPRPRPGLSDGAVGTGDLVFFVVAAAAPLTVMAGVAPLAIGMAGRAAPLGYLISGVLLIVFAAGFTAMSRFVRNAGAFYAYIGRGLGRVTGAGSAYVALYSYNAIEVGLLVAFAWFTEAGFEDLTGAHVPWWVWASAGLVAIGALGYLKVTLSAKVLGVALVLEVLVLLVLEGGVLAHGGGPHGVELTTLSPAHLGESGPAACSSSRSAPSSGSRRRRSTRRRRAAPSGRCRAPPASPWRSSPSSTPSPSG
ncbi:hypothetical protein SALBM135S_03655 [Streptomyces alboniger]